MGRIQPHDPPNGPIQAYNRPKQAQIQAQDPSKWPKSGPTACSVDTGSDDIPTDNFPYFSLDTQVEPENKSISKCNI